MLFGTLYFFLFLVQFGPPFFGTPINKEKGTRILFAITKKKKHDCLITVLPFSPTGAVLNCTMFIWWIYGASQHRMPSSLSILTPKQINLWFLFDEVFCVGNWFVDIDTAIRKTRVPGVNHLIQKHTMRFLRFLASKDRSRIKRGLNMQNL